MTAYLSQLHRDGFGFVPPPILVFTDSDRSAAVAADSVEGLGIRVSKIPVEAAIDRLDSQVAATAVWVELERDGGESTDRLLVRVNNDVREGHYAAVVSAPQSMIDVVAARLDEGAVEQIFDADPVERAAALALALAVKAQPPRIADRGSDQTAERLRRLSDEVNQIASRLARLSSGPTPARKPDPVDSGGLAHIDVELVRRAIRARRLREGYFSPELFADPAWDMLLDLFRAELAQHRVSVSSLCSAAAVPATTALRWIKRMTNEGLLVRTADPYDGRRVFVELSADTSARMRRYFSEVGGAPAL